MEMQDLNKEEERVEVVKEEERGMLETEVKEEESNVYSRLEKPSEDIYSEAGIPYADKPSTKHRADRQILGNVRVYRAVCFLLSILCLALLLGIVILSLKYPTASLVCPEQEKYEVGQAVGTEFPLVCSLKKCKAEYPQFKIKEPNCQLCDEGWQSFENACYYLSKERLNWDDSQKYCQATGGDLAVIINDRVQNFLTQKGNLLYWIGLRYTAQQWTWVTSAALGKSYWSRAVQAGECGLLVGQSPANHSWNTSPCSYSSAYICQTKTRPTLLPAAQG